MRKNNFVFLKTNNHYECDILAKNAFSHKSSSAFTLAEILITLSIIGVIAAVTLPALMVNIQQAQFKTGLRKAVSVLNSVIQTNIAIEGESPYENKDLFNYLLRHMNVLKTYELPYTATSLSQGKGGYRGYYGFNTAIYTTDGMRFELITYDEGKHISGKALKLHESDVQACHATSHIPKSYQTSFIQCGGCGSYGLGNNPNGTLKPPCAIMVDVNGDKKPSPAVNASSQWDNRFYLIDFPDPQTGRLGDVFTILITEDRAIPYGTAAQKAMYGYKK